MMQLSESVICSVVGFQECVISANQLTDIYSNQATQRNNKLRVKTDARYPSSLLLLAF
jgi:hypothetical protein